MIKLPIFHWKQHQHAQDDICVCQEDDGCPALQGFSGAIGRNMLVLVDDVSEHICRVAYPGFQIGGLLSQGEE